MRKGAVIWYINCDLKLTIRDRDSAKNRTLASRNSEENIAEWSKRLHLLVDLYAFS